jgi:inosose dehydratase
MFARDQVWFGITPTGWTNDDFPALGYDITFEQCVSEIALAGFEGCSIGHKFPRAPDELLAALRLRGLRVSEPWVSTYFTVEGMRERTVAEFRRQLAFLEAVGGTDVGVAELGHAVHQRPIALLPNQPRFDDRQWDAMLAGLNELGAMAAAEGARLCYHPHMGTGVQTQEEAERLLAGTDPGAVHLLLDTGHLTWAGGDPVALVRSHGERVAHVHLKDLREEVIGRVRRGNLSFEEALRAGVFTVPGDGTLDFRAILRALAGRGYQGWLVVEAEQDPARAHPLTYARRAREHLREVTGL